MQRNVLDYLEQAMERFPEKVVFEDSEESITYQQLVGTAKSIATNLRDKIGPMRRRPIVVLVDRNIRSVISFFGVVYTGNFYVPVDKDLPTERILSMINLLQPLAILYQESFKECLEGLHTEVATYEYTELIEGVVDETYLKEVRAQSLDTDPLYSIFTSGSTGVPKGVLVGHHSVIDLVDNFKEEFGFDETSIFGNQAPFDFDVSVKDIYSTIKNGATMYIVPKKLFVMPANLITYLTEKKINTIIWATSALVIIENFKSFKNSTPQYLKKVMFSGEVMPNKVLNYWREYLPDVMYVNLYGPTEITCNCTFFKVNRPFDNNDVLPIGNAFLNTGILLLDGERKKEVPVGEIGEICVSGSSLALGYYNNSEKTNEVFIQNPLNANYPETIYCTGDLAKYNENGELLFISRRDFQIKHMGHRIELGEIEVAVNALPFIEKAVCLYDANKKKIVLFYQAGQDYKKEIFEGLGKVLPKYMWPNIMRQYEKLPMNKNAKVDRVKLRDEL